MKFGRFLISAVICTVLYLSCTSGEKNKVDETIDFVDPFIGSAGHGHVFVGANVPFGAVQLGPNNPTRGWDWCSGYHYSDSVLIGFAHTQLSGTGVGDLGDLLFMPVNDAYKPIVNDDETYYWQATYTHDNEIVKPGYYAIEIEKYNIDVELTATERVGFHRYNYKGEGNSKLLIDLEYGTGWDELVKGEVKQVSKNSIEGKRFSTGWAKDQRLFYYTQFSKDINNIEIVRENDELGTYTVIIEFDGNGELMVKTAISPVSIENAKKNLVAEINEEIGLWNFDAVVQMAKTKWDTELGKINIETKNEANKITFYTALYHTMFFPSIYNDHNKEFLGADKKVYKNQDFNNYTTFSLWDTYRAANPLFTLTQTERVPDFINSMLTLYKQEGKLPEWHLQGHDNRVMIGYNAVPIIVDAYFKGIRGFDVDLAYKAIVETAMRDDRGVQYLKEMEFIPFDKEHESVAKAMEYAIYDWGIAQMANDLGHENDYNYFLKRSQYYKNYFDNKDRFFKGKLSNGSWRTGFDPIASSHRADEFCEGNAWQYLWLVPQDVEGLIELLGGKESFVAKLDSLFSIDEDLGESASADISGLIGMYAHGNEPGHHITYLYSYAGQQWKTAEKVRQIMNEMYTDKPDGLCGNEDCGQMSAWYVWSVLGFYPVNPTNGAYVFGSPLVDEAEIKLTNNKSFTVVAHNNSAENIYIQSVKLNGDNYSKSFITHKEILKGGKLEFFMGSFPNKEFGTGNGNLPESKMY